MRKRSIPTLAFALGTALAASACTSTRGAMDRWVGKSRTDVVSAWGAPDGETALDDGRSVVTWTSAWGLWLLRNTCRESFTLSDVGVIETWSYTQCPPMRIGSR